MMLVHCWLSLVSKPEKDFGTSSSQTTVQHENNVKRKCGRTFQESWKQKFNRLIYENEKQRAFCSTCKAARDDNMPLPVSSKQMSSAKCFVEDGFGNWKKALENFSLTKNWIFIELQFYSRLQKENNWFHNYIAMIMQNK